MFYKYALEVSPSVMTSTLMGAFQIDATALGNLAASYFYAYLIMQIPAGLLLDKFGPRKVTTIAITLCALGSLIFAKADTLFLAVIGRFLTGAGAAFAVVNCLKLTANWFPLKQFAFMTGLMMSVGMLGAVGGQAPLSYFIESMNWRSAMEIIGTAGLIFAGIFWFIIRDKSPNHKKETSLVSQKISLFESLKKILTNRQCWIISLYSGFAFAPVMVFGGLWGVSYIQKAFSISHHFASQSVSLIFIGFAVGAPLFGWLSDRVQQRKIVMFCGTLLSFFTISALIYLPGISQIFLMFLLFLFGFAISSFLLCFTMIREITLPTIAATAIGFMNSFDALFGAFSDPLAGKLLDLGWDGQLLNGARDFSIQAYQNAFLILPIYLLISVGLIFFIKETYLKYSSPSSLP